MVVCCGGAGAGRAPGDDVETEPFGCGEFLENEAWVFGVSNNTDMMEESFEVSSLDVGVLGWIRTNQSATQSERTPCPSVTCRNSSKSLDDVRVQGVLPPHHNILQSRLKSNLGRTAASSEDKGTTLSARPFISSPRGLFSPCLLDSLSPYRSLHRPGSTAVCEDGDRAVRPPPW